MKIAINNQRTISDVQKDFSMAFPYLKIEFFNTRYVANQALAKAQMFANTKKLGECKKDIKEGVVSILNSETVAQVESEFWDKFGLCTQVFRRSGNVWIETTLTDAWTLEQQNKEGYEMSSKTGWIEKEDPTDRDLWE